MTNLDFSKFGVSKQANPLQFEKDEEVRTTEKVVVKKLKVTVDPTLLHYKRVWQYCDNCKKEVNFYIINNAVKCTVCSGGYNLSPR